MAIRSAVIKFDGIVAYSNGDKEPFQGFFDSESHITFPSDSKHASNALGYNDTIAKINLAIGPIIITGSLNSVTDPVKDVFLQFNVIVAYDDNRVETFTLLVENNEVRLIGSEQALLDIVLDTTGILDHANKVLSDATVANLTLNFGNDAPIVTILSDSTVYFNSSLNLVGNYVDDGIPDGGTITIAWSKTSGPGDVTFGDDTALNTTAAFSQAGTYVLRLTVNDGELNGFEEITVEVVHNWYVAGPGADPAIGEGDDLNNGQTAATAFATRAKLHSVWQAGDTIGNVRGSHWREQDGSYSVSGASGTNIPIGIHQYAIGNEDYHLPILDASDIIDMSTAILVDGTTNTYEIDVTMEAWAAINFFSTLFYCSDGGNILTDSTRMTRAVSALAVNDVAGTFFIGLTITSAGPWTLRFCPRDGAAPTSGIYEITRRAGAWSGANSNNLLVDGLRCRRAMHTDGTFLAGAFGQITRNLVAEDGVRHCIFQNHGELSDFAMVGTPEISSITGGDGMGVTAYSGSSGGSFLQERGIVISRNPLITSTAYFCHGAVADAFALATIRSCKSIGCQSAFNHADIVEIIIDDCVVWATHGSTGGTCQVRASVGTLTDLRVYGDKSDLTSSNRALEFLAPAGGGVYIVDNCLLATARENGKNCIAHLAGLATINITRTAMATVGTKTAGFPFCLYSNGSAGSIVRYNSTLLVTTANDAQGIRTDANSDVHENSDENHFSTNAFDMRRAGGTNRTTIELWKTNEAPRDANSVVNAITITDDTTLQRETAGMIRFAGQTTDVGPDMTNWNEELDADILIEEILNR